MKRIAIAVAVSAALLPHTSSAVDVLASIKPIEMIAHELVLDGDNTSTLLHHAASPHDYALKPSDIKRIHDSDLVVWIGSDLETFLTKPIQIYGGTSLELAKLDNMRLRKSEHRCGCGAVHTHYDPHVWLGPHQAGVIAFGITNKLVKLNPDNRKACEQKLEKFLDNLELTIEVIDYKLGPVVDKHYLVFHDAYSYFEKFFALDNVGHFTVNPERSIGAKRLIELKTTIKEKNVQCVFSEPQFTPAIVERAVRGTSARKGKLDPLGIDIEVAQGSYFKFLHSLTDSFTDCLEAKGD